MKLIRGLWWSLLNEGIGGRSALPTKEGGDGERRKYYRYLLKTEWHRSSGLMNRINNGAYLDRTISPLWGVKNMSFHRRR
jgi:hypothetical protein